MASIQAGLDLGAREGQHAVRRQGTGEGGLVHIGRQTVATVKFTGDVAVVVLGGHGGRGVIRDDGQQWPPSHTGKNLSDYIQGRQGAGDLTGAGL